MCSLKKNIERIKGVLVSEDVITYEFSSAAGKRFALIYVDGLAEKAQLGELVVKPLAAVAKDASLSDVRPVLASP